MDKNDIELKMMKALEVLAGKMTNIRAGRANPLMLSGINVLYYETLTPLNTLANITVPEARQLFIKPFDRGVLKDIERAINEANLGLTPVNNGEMIILTIPELTEEKRKEYVKQVHLLAEEARIALRNIRQEANNIIKKAELPEDDKKRQENEVQELINLYNDEVDNKVKLKETELMNI